MRTLVGAAAVLMLAGAATAQKGEAIDARKLVGKWERENGKEVLVIEYRANGKATWTAFEGGKEVRKTEGRYKLEGNVLTDWYDTPKGEYHDQSTVLKLTGDELTYEPVGEVVGKKSYTFKRVKGT